MGVGGGVLRRARGCTPWQALRRNAPASVAPATMASRCWAGASASGRRWRTRGMA